MEARKQGYSGLKGLVGLLGLGVLDLIAGFWNADRLRFHCRDCGFEWRE
ncbi:MAG: hypothetical protein MR631_08460 [Selenomonadales bacterium]|nr:hypothetical protein [Selenomonadales bacterium]